MRGCWGGGGGGCLKTGLSGVRRLPHPPFVNKAPRVRGATGPGLWTQAPYPRPPTALLTDSRRVTTTRAHKKRAPEASDHFGGSSGFGESDLYNCCDATRGVSKGPVRQVLQHATLFLP